MTVTAAVQMRYFNSTGETEETPTSSTSATPQLSITPDLVGRFVVVKYDGMPFVCQVLNLVGAELEVSCMRQIMGKNSFVWPTTPDVIFYYASDMQATCQSLSRQQTVGLGNN